MAIRLDASSRLDWAGMPDYSGTNWTFSAWVRKATSGGATNQYIFTTGNFVGTAIVLEGSTEDPTFIVDLATTDKQGYVAGGGLVRGHWKHWTFVNSNYASTLGSSLKIYRDGRLLSQSNTNGSGAVVAWNSTWVLGNRTDNARQLAGDIGPVGLWTRELSAEEIQSLADGLPPERIKNNLAFCPRLTPDFGLFDPVTRVLGTAGAGTFSWAEDPPQVQERRTARIYSFAPPAAGGRTGTLAATESGSDTAAFAGDVIVAGALAATESGSDTAAFAGDVVVQGTLAATEAGADTAAFAGDVRVQGALAATEIGSDTAAFLGSGASPAITGTLAATESGADVAALTGVVRISGAMAATESGADTAAFSSSIPATGISVVRIVDVSTYISIAALPEWPRVA